MKLQTRPQDHQILTTFATTPFKTTSLRLHKHHIPEKAKLDPSKLFVLKHYICAPTATEKVVESWLNGAKAVSSANKLLSAHLEQSPDRVDLIVCQQYQPFGNLSELIDPAWSIDFDLLLNLAHSLKHFHDRAMPIANLKPENILLSRNQKEAVITDFRIPFLERTFEGDELYGKAKLSLYSSEEAKKEYFDEAADIYALGLIYLELVTHQRLQDRQKSTIIAKRQMLQSHGESSLQCAFKRLIGRMLRDDLRRRLSIEQVIAQLQRIRQGQYQLPQNSSQTQLYLPLMFSSQNIRFYLSEFKSGFRTKLGPYGIEIMLDDQCQLLKLRIQVQGCPLLTTYTYDQLPQLLRAHFRTIEDLYQHLNEHQSSLSLANTACLLFPYFQRTEKAAQPIAQNQSIQQTRAATKNSSQSQKQLATPETAAPSSSNEPARQ